MRKLLLALLLLPAFGYSQEKLPALDTVKVIMMASYNPKEDVVTPVSSIYGYSVRKRRNINDDSKGDTYCSYCEDYMLHSHYLDDKKKALKPSIIVWMSQGIK